METKVLEIRDSGTFMPCIAIKLSSENEMETYLLNRAGYSLYRDYILFHPLCTNQINYDQYEWNRGARTVPMAHDYVIKNWASIESGDVIDVQFIIGETVEKKKSERLGDAVHIGIN